MAKKTVASLHDGSKEGRAYTKVIKIDRKSTRLNSSHPNPSRMPSSA